MNSCLFNCCRLLCQVRPRLGSCYRHSSIQSQTTVSLWTLLCIARPCLCQRHLFSSYTWASFGSSAVLTPEAAGLLLTTNHLPLERLKYSLIHQSMIQCTEGENKKGEKRKVKKRERKNILRVSSALCCLIALHDSYSQCEWVDHPGTVWNLTQPSYPLTHKQSITIN